MRIDVRRLPAAVSLVLLTACYRDMPVMPTPPDMTTTLTAFESPPGQLDDSTLRSLGERLRPMRRGLTGVRLLAAHLRTLLEDALVQDETTQGLTAALDGHGEDDADPPVGAGPTQQRSRVQLAGAGIPPHHPPVQRLG